MTSSWLSTLPHATPEKRPHAENIKKDASPKVKQTTRQNPQQNSREAFRPALREIARLSERVFRSCVLRSKVLKKIPPDLPHCSTPKARAAFKLFLPLPSKIFMPQNFSLRVYFYSFTFLEEILQQTPPDDKIFPPPIRKMAKTPLLKRDVTENSLIRPTFIGIIDQAPLPRRAL